MDIRHNKKQLKDSISLGLLVLAAGLGVVIVIKLALGMRPVGDPDLLDPCSLAGQDPCSAKADPNQKLVDALKKKNMFVPPPPKPKPPSQVQGILGKQALINGKWYKAGDTIPPGAKVIAVEATVVKIEWEGKEKILAPIKAAVASGSAKGPKKEESKKIEKKAGPKGPVKKEAVQSSSAAVDDDLAWLDIPDHLKEKVRRFWNMMPEEQRKRAREEWEKMSDEQKEEALKRFESIPDDFDPSSMNIR